MQNIKKASYQNFVTRKPYEPITQVWEIPASLYEALNLAQRQQTPDQTLVDLLQSIVTVATGETNLWQKLKNADLIQYEK